MTDTVSDTVATCARQAKLAAASLAAASDATLNGALLRMAELAVSEAPRILTANERDVAAAEQRGMAPGLVDRLRLGAERLEAIAEQLRILAEVPFPPRDVFVRDLPGDLQVSERRRPIGVIGVNFEARPNVTVDVASQLVKSRNAGVLRTGSAALASAEALIDHVIAPALTASGIDARAVQLVRVADREAAVALVRQSDLIPLVILRGSGDSTRQLSEVAAAHGVRTLAHADGGGVLYLDKAADRDKALGLIESSLDRLGVCNRLNLLLAHEEMWPGIQADVLALLERLGIEVSLPPHDHPLGYEWALDEKRETTVTIQPVGNATDAATTANEQTSGLAATIVTEDAVAAGVFLDLYAGTSALWNATTRWIDGFKLLGVPETGINLDRVPGPRGPVTFGDLYVRQFVVTPKVS